MTAALVLRQQALLAALLGSSSAEGAGLIGLPGVLSSSGGTSLERGLLAYRLNAQVMAAKTLGAVFKCTQNALGDEASFAAMAWAFWRRYPPLRGDLGQWGGSLAEFLAEQDGMPQWLSDLARLEWAAHCCERAADSELDAASLALLSVVEPPELRLLFRPGVQLLRVEAQAWALWADQELDDASLGGSVGLVMARKAWRAQAHCLQDGEWALMTSLLEGADLDLAMQQAFAVQADFEFSVWLQAALLNGWLLGAESQSK
ncbi:DNA-binding domain-containing protein [Paucibacter sp. B2R-40]|uniref:DNA-binding domain-containing protein n=1 Tax=Paucibacter sp. B2R-40 TaxID=2893554 RepID=UPI0021E4A686|nr:DNA-binding domain-containing protein [Paucibacter sp. B2R-40]MCV2355558.1 DNA-binding domain-containing protein [Paucibacter sp. B2R-40]